MYTFDAMFAYFRVWPRLLLISLHSFADYFSMVSVHFVSIIVVHDKKKLLNKYTYNVYTPTTGRWRNDQKWASSCVYKRETNKNCFKSLVYTMIVCAYDMATKWKRKTMYLHEIHNEVIAKIQEVIKVLFTHSSWLQLQLQLSWISDEKRTKDVETMFCWSSV